MKSEVVAKNIMQGKVITLTPEDSLKVAWDVFKKNNISGAPVVDENGMLVGILSQVDLLREAFSYTGEEESAVSAFCQGLPYLEGTIFLSTTDVLEKLSVDAAMHQGVVTVTEDQEVSSIATLMIEQHVHRVVVVNNLKELKVSGIISSLDLAKLLV